MSSAIIFFSFLLMSAMSTFFGISINGMSISRVFNGIPIGAIRTAINPIDGSGNYIPHFNKKILEDNVNEYLIKSLDGYIDSYKIQFTYFKVVENNYLIDMTSVPACVDIYFKCNYGMFLEYEGFRSFRIERIV